MNRRCDIKIRFKTEMDAQYRIRSLKRAGKIHKGTYMKAYKCRGHRCWHIGNGNREMKYLEKMGRIFANNAKP